MYRTAGCPPHPAVPFLRIAIPISRRSVSARVGNGAAIDIKARSREEGVVREVLQALAGCCRAGEVSLIGDLSADPPPLAR